MPTGYTAAVSDGTITDFQAFAMQCARAFGALVVMRDADNNEAIPEKFEPSDYNAKQLVIAQARRAELLLMTPAELDAAALADYNGKCARAAERMRESDASRARYTAMLKKAEAWVAPTVDHQGMKKFMVDQLKESIRFDCGTFSEAALVQLTGEQWRSEQAALIHRDIGYHATAHAEEVERTNSRNAWLKALRDSLDKPA